LSIISVPAEAVSFVTGKGGAFLRMVEEEFGTLLFFIDYNKSRSRDQPERLAIFGFVRMRRGAELKVMAAIEMKQANYFTNRDANKPMVDPQEGFGTDRLAIAEEDYSYALGKGGSTRRKLAKASGCIIEYVGRHAYLCGTKPERKRAREYLCWLSRQRIGPVEVDYEKRNDVTVLSVPKDCVGFVTGHKGTSLRAVEDSTGTFCFIEGGRDDPHRDPKPLLIFGPVDPRKHAEGLLRQRIEQKLEAGWVHEDYGGGGYGNGYSDGKGGHDRKGDRKPKGSGKGKRFLEPSYTPSYGTQPHNGAEADASQQAQAAASASPKEEVVEPEDDEAWGDWGAGSDEDDDDEPAAASAAAVAEASSPFSNAGPGHTPSGAAKWNDGVVPMNFKAERLQGTQELELPPQLVNEGAWPELGAGPKKGKKR